MNGEYIHWLQLVALTGRPHQYVWAEALLVVEMLHNRKKNTLKKHGN